MQAQALLKNWRQFPPPTQSHSVNYHSEFSDVEESGSVFWKEGERYRLDIDVDDIGIDI